MIVRHRVITWISATHWLLYHQEPAWVKCEWKQKFSLKWMDFEMLFAKFWPFCSGFNVLTQNIYSWAWFSIAQYTTIVHIELDIWQSWIVSKTLNSQWTTSQMSYRVSIMSISEETGCIIMDPLCILWEDWIIRLWQNEALWVDTLHHILYVWNEAGYWARFAKIIWASNLVKILFALIPLLIIQSGHNICTCHDSWAVMTCAQLWP